MEYSSQQQAVIDWALNGKGSLNLNALAGCGKTSTLMFLVDELIAKGQGNIFLGAYNKKIADELKGRLEEKGIGFRQCMAGTMHSVGFGAWRQVAPGVKVDGDKVRNILLDNIDALETRSSHTSESLRGYQGFILKAVSIAKQQAAGFLWPMDDDGKWFDLVEHFGMDEDLDGHQDVESGISLAKEYLQRSIALDREVIDFDDMIFAPLYHNARLWPKDWVLIDEAQDTNPARRALALKMMKPVTGRMVAVGDPNQAIYGFTGADSDAMDLIKAELGSKELPLNKTYRCPKAVVEMAQQWVPSFEALPEAPEGRVREITLNPVEFDRTGPVDDEFSFYELAEINLLDPNNDVVLCRLTKPLIDVAFGLIKRDIGCQVEGREIGKGLIKIVNRFESDSLGDLAEEISDWAEKEIQKWQAKGKEQKAAMIDDQCQTLLAICDKLLSEGKPSRASLIAFIESLFGDSNGGKKSFITLSTIHKSKGREWDRVFLLGRNKFMPSKWARKEWQQQQEINLCYVAVTRAKQTLVEIVL